MKRENFHKSILDFWSQNLRSDHFLGIWLWLVGLKLKEELAFAS